MNLDDLKDKLKTEGRATWDRIQESPVYNNLRDRYENLTPVMQKLTFYGGIVAISAFVLSIPLGYFSQSQDYVTEFEGKRMTIRELLKVSRESADVPAIPQAPPIDSIRSTVDTIIRNAGLLPEQIKGTETIDNNSRIIPKNLTEGALQISLAKLNLRQIIDLGHQVQSINSSVKLKDMVITANREDSRYFDVVYKLISLAVPAIPEVAPDNSGKSKTRGRNSESGEE